MVMSGFFHAVFEARQCLTVPEPVHCEVQQTARNSEALAGFENVMPPRLTLRLHFSASFPARIHELYYARGARKRGLLHKKLTERVPFAHPPMAPCGENSVEYTFSQLAEPPRNG